MVKRALVVDDSKSARFALKRMLKTLKLEVDTVESAADAISYLQDHLPDVIFMDHMMPGMDGFEAVKRIKDNPQTAVIPIMMYTSKGGDVYLSEARALGAVGIIRKTIAPVELRSSLLELGIIEDVPIESTLIVDDDTEKKTYEKISGEKKADLSATNTIPAPEKTTIDTYIKDLHRLIDDQTIELHRSMWLGIESASNEIFNRLNSDFEQKLEKIQAQTQQQQSGQQAFYKNKSLWPVYLVSVLLALSVVFNIMLVTENEAVENNLAANDFETTDFEAADFETTDVATTDVIEPDEINSQNFSEDVESTSAPQKAIIEKVNHKKSQQNFIQWASNKIIEYPYDEVALNDKRLPNVEELINKALDANFKGRIILQTHAGVFCLNIDQMGNYLLADNALSIANCEFIGNFIQRDDESTSHQSLSFANFLSDTDFLSQQGIAVEVISLTRRIELSKYPKRSAQTTAETWNQAAQLNNRITVMLEPESIDL